MVDLIENIVKREAIRNFNTEQYTTDELVGTLFKLSYFNRWDFYEVFGKASEVWINPHSEALQYMIDQFNSGDTSTMDSFFVGGAAFDITKPEKVEHAKSIIPMGDEVGVAISEYDWPLVVTGMCPPLSIPHAVSRSVKHNPLAINVGILGDENLEQCNHFKSREHREVYDIIATYDCTRLPLLGKHNGFFMKLLYRDVPNGALGDNLITIYGGGGTAGEATVGAHLGKRLGFLKGSMAFTDFAPELFDAVNLVKPANEKIAYFTSTQPSRLVRGVTNTLQGIRTQHNINSSRFQLYGCNLDDSSPEIKAANIGATYKSRNFEILKAVSDKAGWNFHEMIGKAKGIWLNPESAAFENIIENDKGPGFIIDGSSIRDSNFSTNQDLARSVGQEIARMGHGYVIINYDHSVNISQVTASAMKNQENSMFVVGIADIDDLKICHDKGPCDLILAYDFHSMPQLVDSEKVNDLYARVVSGNLGDILISIGGDELTANLATITYHQQLVNAFLQGSGGFSDVAQQMFTKIFDEYQKPAGTVFFDEINPEKLVRRALAEYLAKDLKQKEVEIAKITIYDHIVGAQRKLMAEIRHSSRPVTDMLRHDHLNVRQMDVLQGSNYSNIWENDLRTMAQGPFVQVRPKPERGEKGVILMSDPSRPYGEALEMAQRVVSDLRHPRIYQYRAA